MSKNLMENMIPIMDDNPWPSLGVCLFVEGYFGWGLIRFRHGYPSIYLPIALVFCMGIVGILVVRYIRIIREPKDTKDYSGPD